MVSEALREASSWAGSTVDTMMDADFVCFGQMGMDRMSGTYKQKNNEKDEKKTEALDHTRTGQYTWRPAQ